MNNPNVVAIIPAHNEQDNIERLIQDLLSQTYPIKRIIVVADNCTDNTTEKVLNLQKRFSNVCCIETQQNLDRKAGAINTALNLLSEKDYELALVMDADCSVSTKLLENAVESFKKDNRLGGVCSTAHVLKSKNLSKSWIRKIESKFLYVLQKLEYGGFDAERTATWKSVTILHGLCGVYRLAALKEVGGYTLNHLIEDYDLTLKIKKKGWNARFNSKMCAWTEVPTTFKSFFRQRLRWMRGGVDVLLDHGINKFTVEDVLHHFIFILLFMGILGFVFFSTLFGGWSFRFNPHPIPVALVIVGYLSGIYKLKYVKNLNFWDILFRIIILPELIMAIMLMSIRLYAYYLAILRRPQKW